MSDTGPHPADEPQADLEQYRDLLARTVEYLGKCAEDPASAREAPTPENLIHDLEAMISDLDGSLPPARHHDDQDPPVDLHRRRSA